MAPVKKASSRNPAPSTPRRGRRRTVEYLLLILGGVLLVNALVGDKGLLAMLKARQDFQVLESSLTRARTENERLREEGRRLREDPTAIEDIARRELGLLKPGEKVFIVKDVAPGEPR